MAQIKHQNLSSKQTKNNNSEKCLSQLLPLNHWWVIYSLQSLYCHTRPRCVLRTSVSQISCVLPVFVTRSLHAQTNKRRPNRHKRRRSSSTSAVHSLFVQFDWQVYTTYIHTYYEAECYPAPRSAYKHTGKNITGCSSGSQRARICLCM